MESVLMEKNVMVPTRDGARLATDVYRLDAAASAPVLLARTPYNKQGAVAGGDGVAFDIIRAVQAGSAVVIQDVRGRCASDGEFRSHFQEPADGADAIAWADGQAWSGGVVSTFGAFYLGNTSGDVTTGPAAAASPLILPVIER